MANEILKRQPHAVLDIQSRRWKGMKIEHLLDLRSRPQPLHILEIGTGSGGIAYYFGIHPDLQCNVTAVDIYDNRVVHEGYEFKQLHSIELPFDASCFDVVITNHVIEHVGDIHAQCQHLAEIRRVLKKNGVGYLAVPNRWMLVEPHYQLVFLSWLPHAWRTPYLRLCGKGDVYDCEPLEMRQLERMLDTSGFCYENLCIAAWRATLEIERPGSLGTRIFRIIPDLLLMPLRRIIPTLIYKIEPN